MSVDKVVMYTKSYCPFSKECKHFFDEKGVSYTEKMVDGDTDLEAEMVMKSDERADTPQVFINGHHIGSFDDVKALEASGKLDEVLNP
jgi:glutaredoxin 3